MIAPARGTPLAAALALLVCLAFAQVSDAYWTNSSTGSTTAGTATMPAGTAPTASVSATTVTVSIPQISVAGQLVGALGGAYVVKRYPGSGGTAATPVGGTCAAAVTGAATTLTCTEVGTPRGDWKYTVSPILYQWTTTESAASNTVTIAPDPASGLTAARAPAAAMSLSWTAGPGATGYNVYRRTTAGSYNFAAPVNGATPVSGTTFTDSTAVSGTSYNYVVRSVVIGSSGQKIESANSNETAALTADGTVPTGVTLTTVPANIKDQITITGSANDTISGVASMLFEYRVATTGTWTTLCTEPVSPYDCDIDSTLIADGLYDFRVTAIDGAGNQTVSTVQTNKRIDNTDPVTTMNAIADYVKGTITVGGTATDTGGSGIASVALNIRQVGSPSWTTLCTSATSPISCSLNTTTRADGDWEIQIVATDNAGNTPTVPDDEPFAIDNTAPTVTMTNPGAALAGTILLESTPADAGSGVASVQYQYKLSTGATWTNACLSSASPFSCSFNTTTLADGNYDFRAIASDALGTTTTSAAITGRTIDNSAPSGVTMNNPGSPIRATVTLGAAATDTGAGINNVTIQRSPAGLNTWTTVCADTTSPYTCSFDTTTVADGLYDFRAIATDNSNNSTTSAAVTGRRIDNTAPANTLTNPGSPKRGTVTLNATATDTGSGMVSVAFQYKLSSGSTWTTIATDTSTPYSASWVTTGLNNTYDIRSVATDIAGNQSLSTITGIVIDNTAPTAVDIQTANGGAIAGRPDAGDTITYTFSEPMQPTSILAGWSGASTAITYRLRSAGTDTMRPRTTTGVNLPLGTTTIGTSWVTATAVFNATMVMSGNQLIVTLGAQTSGTVATSNATWNMVWTPSATATDLAGNAMSTTARTETGAADREF